MHATKAATLAAVLALALGGCRNVTGPQVPQPEPKPGVIHSAEADLKHGHVRFVIDGSRFNEGNWQIFLNTDNNRRTGYSRFGSEYLVNGSRTSRGFAQVQRTQPPIDPEQGWGEVTGYARFEVSGSRLEVRIPLESIGGAESMGWVVFLYADGVAYLEGQLAAPALAVAE